MTGSLSLSVGGCVCVCVCVRVASASLGYDWQLEPVCSSNDLVLPDKRAL